MTHNFKLDWEVGYKIVKALPSGLWSIFYHQGAEVRYSPMGKIVAPKKSCGPLAVFVDLPRAEVFARVCIRHHGVGKRIVQIFECLYLPSEEKSLWRIHRSVFSRNLDTTPWGTVFASRLKLLGKNLRE